MMSHTPRASNERVADGCSALQCATVYRAMTVQQVEPHTKHSLQHIQHAATHTTHRPGPCNKSSHTPNTLCSTLQHTLHTVWDRATSRGALSAHLPWSTAHTHTLSLYQHILIPSQSRSCVRWLRCMCCSVLQYAVVCCSVLQCAAVCCSVLQSRKGPVHINVCAGRCSSLQARIINKALHDTHHIYPWQEGGAIGGGCCHSGRRRGVW